MVEIHDLHVRFHGASREAVAGIDLTIRDGEVVGLVGESGSGKTVTAMVVSGLMPHDRADVSGQVLLDGKDTHSMTTAQVNKAGIARTFQSIRLFGKLPALENVLAGRHCRLKSGFLSSMLHTPWQRREEKAAVERCMEELEFVGLADHYAEAASSLSYGNQRLLEIARALASDPRLLILDEPAGGMNDQETVALVDTIAAIRDRGITVLLIEHDMRLVMQICEHLVVLENGTLIAQGTPDHVRNHPAVIEAYLGSDDSETW